MFIIFVKQMAEVARGHGGNGGDKPPHGVACGVPSGCQSCKLYEILKY